jgi:hypothetical protein
VLAGWVPTGEARVFDAENIYELVNGQADAYFAYAFEQAAVQGYEGTDGTTVRVEVWQLATPADAYGLFTTYRSGTPVAIGNEGDADPGRRLDFWQDHYFVRLLAAQSLPGDELQAFAEAVADALPRGGQRPALSSRLPQEGLMDRESIFFRQEISIQDYLWLGGQNLLGLGPETAGMLAHYQIDAKTATLLLVEYPDAEAASAALAALHAGQISDLVLAEAQQNLLGAMFGSLSEAQARALLSRALESN